MRVKLIIAVVALVLIAAFLLLGGDEREEPPVPAGTAPSPAESAPAPAADPVSSDTTAGVATLATHATLEIDRASLTPGEPLVLHLQLGEPAAGAQPLSGRLVVEGREPVDLTEVIQSAGPGVARLELDSRWLSPGRNILEVRTNERSHLPLRRYVVEVR